MRRSRLVAYALAAGLIVGVPAPARADKPGPPSASPVAQDRSVEAVVLTGAQFPGWSAGPEISFREPVLPFNSDCATDPFSFPPPGHEDHNCVQASRIPNNPNVGAAVERLVGYRWNHHAKRFVQIPFQVDERFTRYISNIASNYDESGLPGFGAYSGADAQLSYVYDREGFHFTAGGCDAESDGTPAAEDPVNGLDDNDELVFLYRDAGQRAPAGAALPKGVSEVRAVRVDDPSAPDMLERYAYVGLAAGTNGATPAYDKDNGYLRYVRDPDADRYEETSDNYGNAPRGVVCDAEGVVVQDNVPRRPRDTAWVYTPRYAFRYEGRWILRGMRVAPGDHDRPLDLSAYGPPLVDQWKARAYQQRPGTSTPCCGFETEQDSWGDSSVLLGERAGPVRVIRTTWGSDSGTNTVRQEIFYPDVVLQQAYLRVHPIPPLGGIFSYWDHTAGVITRYYNAQRGQGVPVDGTNDEVFGTMYAHAARDKVEVRDEDKGFPLGPISVPLGGPYDDCRLKAFDEAIDQRLECSDVDVTDPTLNATGTLSWEQVAGPHGSMVFRSRIKDLTPGSAQAFAAIPYYRDDSCFDDGTGIDPGPHLNPKGVDSPERPCWVPDEPAPDPKWRQGAIGSHGVQLLFVPESDNAFLTVPVTELATEQRIVVLPGDPGNVGDRYGRASDFPLQTTVLPL